MRVRRGLAAIAGLLAMAFAVSADTVVMKNGDRLTGIVEVSDGKNVTLKTDYAGEIQIAWASIAEVKSDKPIYVVMPDKGTVSGLVTTEGSNIIIHPASGPPVQLAVSQVTVVRGADQETAYEKSLHPGILEAWKGGVNLGFALARGNSETTNLTTGFTADRKTMTDETTAYFTSLYSTNDKTGGGTIEVGSVQGNVNVETGGGNIKIGSVKGEIKAESGGGNVVLLSGLQGAVLETGAGSIRVDKCNGMVKASTGGGSVDLGEIGGPAQIETGAGSIRLASAKGRVEAQTGGGSIQLDGATSVQAQTSAGGIIVKLLSSNSGAVRNNSTLETSVGDITVYLANDLAISIRAEIEIANGHTIRSDFSDIHVSSEGGQWEPKTVTAEGQLNGGGPVLKVRTNSGNVNFRRVSH